VFYLYVNVVYTTNRILMTYKSQYQMHSYLITHSCQGAVVVVIVW